MALSEEKIKKIRETDRINLKSMTNKAETISARTLDKLRQEHEELVTKIRTLHEEKGDLMRSLMSRAELVEYAKNELKRWREETLSVLRDHLANCQRGHAIPFGELSMKSLFAEGKAYRLPCLIITDRDIKTLVDELPESGMTAAERDAKIAAIDDQIKELMAKLDDGQ